ncbi:MAG: hypothetical protein ACOC3Z_01275 [Nanoarchaeota archaeon]
MNNQEMQQDLEARLVENMKEHINQNIELNKRMSGIDFSFFMGSIVNFCGLNREGKSDIVKEYCNKELYLTDLSFQLIDVAKALSEDYKKRIDFSESSKAVLQSKMVHSPHKIQDLYEYAERLQKSEENIIENRSAMNYLSTLKKYGKIRK